jgi:hypothetical protein
VVVIQGVSPAEVRGLAENCGATVAEKLLDAGAGDMLARMRAMVASGAANQG